jgi:soluble lytic murein transglycosylase-like protein
MIEAAAAPYHLDPDLIEAIVVMESSGNADAFRYEPGFWDRYLQHTPPYSTQIPRRVSSSYGLMQVMYSTAVEHGFVGEPEELFVPMTALDYGCRVLASMLKTANGNVPRALASYNAGPGNWSSAAGQSYANRVLRIKNAIG